MDMSFLKKKPALMVKIADINREMTNYKIKVQVLKNWNLQSGKKISGIEMVLVDEEEDIKLMKELNMDAFRFSISWARLIPSGKLKDGVNEEAVQFYKDLIDEFLANGTKAAGRCSKWVNEKCHAGDSSTEPYIVSHHILLAHAAAVDEFRKCKTISHDSQIGIVLSPGWLEPYHSDSTDDKEAVQRALAFEIGWHLDPVVYGDYPEFA
ncbi:unnamed protein product [Microthlaspi erraticum]|uniref:Thioglucosidase n=1 Tax=Microthlaspi erraticum TaxID=1685480 RepID=A0A6D2IYU9_9BRAS|nr:unnamed protein product [Microthlaspi erraticum]